MGFHWGSAPHFLPPAPQRPVAVANRRCPLAKAWPGPQALPRDSDGRVGADELAEGLARLPRARCASGAGEVATAAGAGLDGRVGLPALERAVRAGLTRRCEATIREARRRMEVVLAPGDCGPHGCGPSPPASPPRYHSQRPVLATALSMPLQLRPSEALQQSTPAPPPRSVYSQRRAGLEPGTRTGSKAARALRKVLTPRRPGLGSWIPAADPAAAMALPLTAGAGRGSGPLPAKYLPRKISTCTDGEVVLAASTEDFAAADAGRGWELNGFH